MAKKSISERDQRNPALSPELTANLLPGNLRGAILAAAANAVIAALVLIGWGWNIEVLKRIVPGLVAMNPMTAVTFLIAAVSVVNFAREKRTGHTTASLWVGRVCAIFVGLVGALQLIALFSGHSFQFDQWLFRAKLAVEALPSTIAPNTAFNFLLIGCALLFLQSRNRRVSGWACVLALIAGFEALLVIIGYTYRVHGFYGVGSHTPMAFHTAICFALLVCGIMSYQANRGFLAIILGGSAGGRMAQRLLPAAILVPVVLGWLRLEGQRLGLYDPEFGVALYTVTNMLVFASIVSCNAYSLFRTDIRRTQAELRLRRAHDELEARVCERTEELSKANAALQSAQGRLEERVRKRTTSLAQTEARLHAIVDNATAVIYVKDLEGKFVLVNECFEMLLGVPKAEIIGRTGHDLYPAATADAFRANDLAALQAGVALESEERVERPEGVRTFISSKFPLREASGEIYALCCVSTEITERKKAEDEIRQVHKFLDSVVENIPDMVCVKEATNLTFARLNKAGEQLLGLSRGQLLGKNDHNLFPKEQADLVTAQDRLVLQGRKPLDIPEEMIETARGTRLVHTKKIPILDENGAPTYLLGVSTDITERKRAEDALHESNRELEMAVHANDLIMKNSRDVICTVDEAGRFTTVSAASEAVWGYCPAELRGRPYLDLVYPEDRPKTIEIAEAMMAGSPVTEFENRCVRKDGSLINVLWSAYWSEADKTMFAVAHDNTVHKQAEEALRESEARFASCAERTERIVATAHDAFIGMDAAGLITDWNPQAETTFGWSAEEAIGRPMHELIIPPKFREMHVRGIKHFLATGNGPVLNKRIEFPALHRDGRELPIEVTISPIPVGDTFMFSAFLRDVSNRKRAEEKITAAKEEAERANRAKSEFLSRMSHELRTPMNAILGFAQLLALEDLSPEQREGLGHIMGGGELLLKLINEVLDISRIEAGRLSLSREPVEIAEVLREIIHLMKPLAAAARVRLDLPQVGTTYVLADRQRLRQVLINLVSNAIKYNRAGGSISLACEVSNVRARISVRDTGIGIPNEHLEQVFSPFERLGVEQGEIEGTGLGLTVTKRLVEAMEGTIGVESRVGEGTTFWVEFALTESPLARSAEGRPPSEIEAVIWGEGGTVLYVEDNFSNLKLIESLFRLRPALKLIAARDGKSGLQMAREQLPVLILLDLNLPDMNGRDVLTKLRTEPMTSAIPVVALSADATPGQIDRLMRAGAADYLTKPINVQKFLEVLDRTLHITTPPARRADLCDLSPAFKAKPWL